MSIRDTIGNITSAASNIATGAIDGAATREQLRASSKQAEKTKELQRALNERRAGPTYAEKTSAEMLRGM